VSTSSRDRTSGRAWPQLFAGRRQLIVYHFMFAPDWQVFHTYSAYARGIDLLNTDYNLLDLTPKGRDEAGRGPFWVRRHDE
jgi:predicted dithiol-disulfide oxidoreductase (DUF899 family)